MSRSFLNIVTVDGKLCRIAEFGFHADCPSFDGNGILFRKGTDFRRIDLDTGIVGRVDSPKAAYSPNVCRTSPDGLYTVRLELASPDADGKGYVHMMLRDNKKSTETVLTRFMGTENSMGAMPFSEDSVTIAFFGYPEDELGK